MRERTGMAPRTAAVVLLLATLAVEAGAAQQSVDRAASEIFGSVMSPFCPGLLLSACPSSQATDLREAIRQRLAAGATKDQVLRELYETYGEEVLGAPRAAGLGLIAWLVPLLTITLSALMLGRWVHSSARRARTVQTAPPLDPEAARLLDAELSRL